MQPDIRLTATLRVSSCCRHRRSILSLLRERERNTREREEREKERPFLHLHLHLHLQLNLLLFLFLFLFFPKVSQKRIHGTPAFLSFPRFTFAIYQTVVTCIKRSLRRPAKQLSFSSQTRSLFIKLYHRYC